MNDQRDGRPDSSVQNIMVVVIPAPRYQSSRIIIEEEISNQLNGLGYNGQPGSKLFGLTGIAEGGAEATYIKLRQLGIDLVWITAMIPEREKSTGIVTMPASRYYNRAWEYNELVGRPGIKRYTWETILFDLHTLQPICIVHTRFPREKQTIINPVSLSRSITGALSREGVLEIIKSKKPF
jgi:hypothetical protein